MSEGEGSMQRGASREELGVSIPQEEIEGEHQEKVC